MAESNVTQFSSLINQQVESREALNEYLSKAEALTQISMGDDFLEHSPVILHYYFWILSDIIEHAKTMNENSLDVLLKQKPLPNFNDSILS